MKNTSWYGTKNNQPTNKQNGFITDHHKQQFRLTKQQQPSIRNLFIFNDNNLIHLDHSIVKQRKLTKTYWFYNIFL